jgi:8-oxo-dGTP diphosphatase
MKKLPVHVVVGVIMEQDKVLIAKRPDHVHMGGYWEFPGGKIEKNESVLASLRRELHEELNIDVQQAEPLIRIHHDYQDRSVLLDVYKIIQYSGVPHGKEGQAITWRNISQLNPLSFPPANLAIINAIQLPDSILITGSFDSERNCIQKIETALSSGIRLIQLRAKHLSKAELKYLADRVAQCCEPYHARLLCNVPLEWIDDFNDHGIHLTGQQLKQCKKRPVGLNRLLSTSVHSIEEMLHANQCQVDLVLASPVKPTLSHPDMKSTGWEGLKQIIGVASCPVYALGGMQKADIDLAHKAGAQGIAAISAFWPD